MLMPRASGSVFKLCKSNINAKPVINNLSASQQEGYVKGVEGDGRRGRRGRREEREREVVKRVARSVRRKKRTLYNGREEGGGEGEKKRGISRQDGKRLYYTCLGAFSLRLREQDEKAHGPHSLDPSYTYSTNKDAREDTRGEKWEVHREGILRKGAEEF